MHLRKACFEDLETVVELYEAAKRRPGCVWDEDYPTRQDATGDLETGNLYVLDLNGTVIGAVSVLCENELDEFDFWRVADGTQREIVRVVVSQAHKGKGLAVNMLSALFDLMAKEGCHAIHLAAAKENPPALATYRKMGFDFMYEGFMFGHDYWVCEKVMQ